MLFIENITIPSAVSSIDALTFESCSELDTVTIVEGIITIGDSAFQECLLKSVAIPISVTSIGSNPFISCIILQL